MSLPARLSLTYFQQLPQVSGKGPSKMSGSSPLYFLTILSAYCDCLLSLFVSYRQNSLHPVSQMEMSYFLLVLLHIYTGSAAKISLASAPVDILYWISIISFLTVLTFEPLYKSIFGSAPSIFYLWFKS